jgi:hypothetical protein
MEYKNKVKFQDLDLKKLKEEAISFLNLYGQESILGEEFLKIIGNGGGKEKFKNLLNVTGFEENSEGFLSKIKEELSQVNGNKIYINNVLMPYHFLFFILKKLIPGRGFITVKTVEQLKKITNKKIPEQEKKTYKK